MLSTLRGVWLPLWFVLFVIVSPFPLGFGLALIVDGVLSLRDLSTGVGNAGDRDCVRVSRCTDE